MKAWLLRKMESGVEQIKRGQAKSQVEEQFRMYIKYGTQGSLKYALEIIHEEMRRATEIERQQNAREAKENW